MGALTVDLAPAPTSTVRALIAELEGDLSKGYATEQQHGLSLEGIFQPHVRFFTARLDGEIVGCGGVALFDGFAEVKRMYIRPTARGRGVAQALMARFAVEARDAGVEWLRLETGNVQHAAMRMYERAGFTKCAAFGAYAAMDPYAVATSVFYEMRIK